MQCVQDVIGSFKKDFKSIKRSLVSFNQFMRNPSNATFVLMLIITFQCLMMGLEFALSAIPETHVDRQADINFGKEDSKPWIDRIKQIAETADEPRADPYKAYLLHLFGIRGYIPDEEPTEGVVETKEPPAIRSYISSAGPTSDTCIRLPDDGDLKVLASVIYREAKGESLKGQVAVGAVILNRCDSNDYGFTGKTFIEICTDEYQFASGIDSVTDEMLKSTTCYEAAQLAARGWDPTREVFPDGAKFFYNPDSPDVSEYQLSIREGVKTLRIGNHVFHDDFNYKNARS